MYENIKYDIVKIKNHPGPQFEVVVLWKESNKFEHIFFNDRLLEDDKLIDELDIMWEQLHNIGTPTEQSEKKSKLDNLAKKYVKKVK